LDRREEVNWRIHRSCVFIGGWVLIRKGVIIGEVAHREVQVRFGFPNIVILCVSVVTAGG
jgi:hypothetical protein